MTSRIALMIQRVMNASSHAMPSVATLKIANSSQPSRKLSTPKIAATSNALFGPLTWKPGRMALVTQTARVRISQERIRFMLGALVAGVVTLPTGTRRMDSIVRPHHLR
jgi:hypothetical protein